jgi:hypothetical protein
MKYTGPRIWQGIAPICEGRHLFARDLKKYLGTKTWDACFKFAFVRNPWDRLVSWYHMIRLKGPQNHLWKYALNNSCDFESFVKNCTQAIYESPFERKSFSYNQYDYVSDAKGRILVDYIGRFENLENDLEQALRMTKTDTPVQIPHLNTSQHSRYRDYYNEETRKIVAERFRKDIEFFGYHF